MTGKKGDLLRELLGGVARLVAAWNGAVVDAEQANVKVQPGVGGNGARVAWRAREHQRHSLNDGWIGG